MELSFLVLLLIDGFSVGVVSLEVFVALELAGTGFIICGNEALFLASSSLGMNRPERCPQPAKLIDIERIKNNNKGWVLFLLTL